MLKKQSVLAFPDLLLICALAHADFKFTQSGQVAQASVASGATDAFVTTTYVKGSYLRIDLPDGNYGIIDLDGRREIEVDPKSRTYFILPFDTIRASDEAYERQEHQWGFHHLRAQGAKTFPGMKWTTRTQVLLGQPTRELAVSLVTQTPLGPNPSPRHTIEVKSWVALAVAGFAEVKDFYAKLAAMMSWAPVPAGTRKGFLEVMWAALTVITAHGPRGARWSVEPAICVPLMTKGILDLYGTTDGANGLPMLLSFRSSTARVQNQGTNGGSPRAQRAPEGAAPNQSSKGGPARLELDIRTASYSTETLDPSLFQVPTGYSLSHAGAGGMWIASIGRNGVLLPLGM